MEIIRDLGEIVGGSIPVIRRPAPAGMGKRFKVQFDAAKVAPKYLYVSRQVKRRAQRKGVAR